MSSGQPSCRCRSRREHFKPVRSESLDGGAPVFQQISDKVAQFTHRLGSHGLKFITEQGGVEGLGTFVVLARSLQTAAERFQRLRAARLG